MESAENQVQETADISTPRWTSMTRLQRRVAGVLVEKSKTTPDVYPMTLNGIKTGSNQKSNRSPKLDLEEHQVESVLYELREIGAVVEVHSGGRVPKFKHQMYEWLGVEKAELVVMAELLLRGEQTVGELRARAARMEKTIAGMTELKPILASLLEKNLIVELTPAGRGQMVTHNLYEDRELEKIRRNVGSGETPVTPNQSSSNPRKDSKTTIQDSRNAAAQGTNSVEARLTVLEQELKDLKELVQRLID